MSVTGTLDALRAAGDRAGFARVADALASEEPLAALRICLPRARDEVLTELLGADLKLRPCFGDRGSALTVRDEDALDLLVELGHQLGPGLARLVVTPGIGRERLHALLSELPLEGLVALRMDGNNIRCREAQVVHQSPRVIQLRILGDDRILRAIHSLPMLSNLRLCENRLGTPGARALAGVALRRLNLRNNQIGDGGAGALSDSPAEILELEHNGIGPVGAEMLALGCARVLDLSRNELGDDGARLLARGNFEGLRLDACGIGDSGALALLGLREGRVLSLRRNPISAPTIARLRETFEVVNFDE